MPQKNIFEHRLGVLHSDIFVLESPQIEVFLMQFLTFEFPGATILKCDVLRLQCQAPSRYLTLYESRVGPSTVALQP